VIGISDPQGQFGDFVSLGCGSEIKLTSANRSFLLSIAGALENYEVYFLICGDFDDEMSVSQFCMDLRDFEGIESESDRVIPFIDSPLFEIEREFLIRLPISTLEQILSHNSLRIDSENSLYDFVISILDSCSDSVFLEQIRFTELDSERIDRFIT
jgi:hypothetical protein